MPKGTFCKVCEREKQDFHVVDIAHRALTIVHAFEIAFGIIGQDRLDRLGHVAEFLEGDA